MKYSRKKFVLLSVIGAACLALFLLIGHNWTKKPLISTLAPVSLSSLNASVNSQSAANDQKVIFLTIDADMSQSMHKKMLNGEVKLWYDPRIIKYLKDNTVPATFFVSGLFAESYPDLVKELNDTGNYTFENHGYDESGFTPKCYNLNTLNTDAEKIDQIQKTQTILKKMTGRTPTYFRFPGICQSQHDDDLVKSLGIENNDGDVVASDPFNTNTQAIVKNVLNNAKPNGVIIMHIGGPNAPKSYEVLTIIVPKLINQGYTIKHL